MYTLALGAFLSAAPPAHASDFSHVRGLTARELCQPGARSEVERRLCAKRRYLNARTTRRAGQVLTVTGLVPAAVGSWIYVSAATMNCDGPYFMCEGKGFGLVLGGLVTVSSLPFLVSGIPMWVHGRKRELRFRPMADVSMGGGRLGVVVEF